ncbi:MAG: YraN family protein [Ferruginibacter sp.]
MARHIHTGKEGELLAAAYFTQQGYRLLEQNWRYSHWEVDIIAEKNNVLHFIEVKARRSKNFGLPEEKVNNKKIQNLVNAAEEYLYQHPHWKRIQFDILSIIILKNSPVEYFLIEDISL